MNKTNTLLGVATGLLLAIGFLAPLTQINFAEMNGENYNQGESLGYGVMLLSALGALVAMIVQARRETEVKFAGLIKTGLFTAFITTIVFYVCNVLFYSVIQPGFLSDFMEAFIRSKSETIPDEAKRLEYINSMEKDKGLYTNSFIYSGIMAITVFMISLMPVAVCGYVIFRVSRRKKAQKPA